MLPRIRFRDLRHSCASLLRAQGADARLIMEILGHGQISTTLDVYTHLFSSAGQDAVARMDAAFATKPPAASEAADS